MTKDEALELALEALELVNIEFVCNGAHHAKKDRHELGDECPVTNRYRQSIIAIKEALAQPEQYSQIAINPEIVGYVAPQSTWVRLTDEEIYKIYTKEGWNGLIFAHAIESKLKTKNTRGQE